MSKISKKIAVFIFFLALVILLGLFVNTSADMKMPVDMKASVDTKVPVDTKTPFQGKKVAGFFIEFEEGTTEPEVKAILENYNMTVNTIDYNSDIMPSRYYMILDRDKTIDIEELVDEENLTGPIKKGNNYIITVTEQAIQDKNFLAILEKNNLPVKKSVYCYIRLEDESKNGSIPQKDAYQIANELERNEKVLTASPDTRVNHLLIEFEDGTAEQEVKAILEKYNTTMNTIEYDSDLQPERYYLVVDADKRMDVRNELRKDENWTDPIYHDIKKGNHYIITVTEQAVQDKNFLALLEKNNLQVKNSVLCCITLGDGSKNWIWESDERRIENELKMNEKVLTVMPSGSTGST
ncbi:hypothetical protein MSSIH_0920 [Methanosarcina siciliae HI350]|uniref:Uncharacterized protein n=2 Tax=Methanosarcina siciliae TaxID=38027 RepID=A0A0E3PBT2_9EURY|nr:UPF0228 family protein [Methanosarcina siciliae]AKB31610.1 hypothetical protein MSSIH_0920 [Methanosarcina siciliae HI350]